MSRVKKNFAARLPDQSQPAQWAWRGWFRLVGTLRLRRGKRPSPRSSGRGPLQSERVLVVQVGGGGCRFVEVARGANLALAGIGPLKPGGQVPVQMVDGVRVFCVGLGQFA